ncbi:Smr/MutS family protein [Mycoplasmopsis hyopharyngis]|uniref:Smr/MutS family protein n=1 Tax=Mycoplasmopsis hyopharyngis TaxID=29558 RepID=UPI0038733690
MKIDLHGLQIESATPKITLAIEEFLNSNNSELIIITGRGTGALKVITENILDSYVELEYFQENNGGVYRVTKIQNEESDPIPIVSLKDFD